MTDKTWLIRNVKVPAAIQPFASLRVLRGQTNRLALLSLTLLPLIASACGSDAPAPQPTAEPCSRSSTEDSAYPRTAPA